MPKWSNEKVWEIRMLVCVWFGLKCETHYQYSESWQVCYIPWVLPMHCITSSLEHSTTYGKGSSMLQMRGQVLCHNFIKQVSEHYEDYVWTYLILLRSLLLHERWKVSISRRSRYFFVDMHTLHTDTTTTRAECIAPCCACTCRVIVIGNNSEVLLISKILTMEPSPSELLTCVLAYIVWSQCLDGETLRD